MIKAMEEKVKAMKEELEEKKSSTSLGKLSPLIPPKKQSEMERTRRRSIKDVDHEAIKKMREESLELEKKTDLHLQHQLPGRGSLSNLLKAYDSMSKEEFEKALDKSIKTGVEYVVEDKKSAKPEKKKKVAMPSTGTDFNYEDMAKKSLKKGLEEAKEREAYIRSQHRDKNVSAPTFITSDNNIQSNREMVLEDITSEEEDKDPGIYRAGADNFTVTWDKGFHPMPPPPPLPYPPNTEESTAHRQEKDKITKTHKYSSKFDFLITKHLGKIKNQEDYMKFLEELSSISLGVLSLNLPNVASYSDMFTATEKKHIFKNVYDMILLYLLRFGTNIFGIKENFETQKRKLMGSMQEVFHFKSGEFEKINKLISQHSKDLFGVIIHPYYYTGRTKEEFAICMGFVKDGNFKIRPGSDTDKILSISALDFIRNRCTFSVEVNFLKEEINIILTDTRRKKYSDDLSLLERALKRVAKNTSKKKEDRKVFSEKITINKKEYSQELFEEMIETDVKTFLANLEFEEENYEERIFEETI